MSRLRLALGLAIIGCLAAVAVHAQRSGRGAAAPMYADERGGIPVWELNKELPKDVFTFVRVRYSSGGRGYWGGRGRWAIDYPDADLNFSYRLAELTAMKVHPEGIVLDITDPELFNYPFIYMVEPGALVFSEEEVQTLRRYFAKGGFMMVDDFWGPDEYDNFYFEIKRVFPDREPVELPLEHPIFHCVMSLKEKPQVPNVGMGVRSQYDGRTWEDSRDRDPHYKAILDDKGRIMVMICHNTDLGDGWEREGEDSYYFTEFSEKKAYPLGINIIFYAMTH
ncbi:MAG: DUF4159 domain-containing protein [Verrucomicrobiota bacterium]